MKKAILIINTLFCFSCNSDSNKINHPTLEELQKVERSILESYVKHCNSEIAKTLCRNNWYTSYNLEDSIIIFNHKKPGYLLDFKCNSDLFREKNSTATNSWWALNNDTLEISINHKSGEYKSDNYETDNQNRSINHNIYRIVQIDSLLILKRIESIENSLIVELGCD